MVKRIDLDPIAEAEARVRLRYMRARAPATPARPVGLAAERIARKALPDKGPAIERLKNRWSSIVGAQIAKYCRPEKFTSRQDGRVLTLKVLPAAAPMIQHQGETIRQRVSAFSGGDVVALKLVQGQLNAAPPPRKSAPARDLSPDEVRQLDERAAGIEDPALRAAIVSLGRAMLTAEE